MPCFSTIRTLSAGLGVSAAIGLAAATAAGELAPHRAIYTLTMGQGDPTGRFVGVQGLVRTVVEKTCDGWITTEQIKMHIDTQVGGGLSQFLDFTGWESADGRRYRFVARSRINEKRTDYKGRAHADPGGPGAAIYTQPSEMTLPLPAGTRFYFGLTSWLVEQASAGRSRAETVVFDGTDDEGPQRAVAFIVPLEKPDETAKAAFGDLVGRPGWSVRLAFYPVDGRAAAPDYEVQAVVLDNGVTPRMELVFPDFTAIQKLEKIEALKAPEC